MAVFTLTAGIDTFTGTAGQDNTFNFTQSTLQSTDTVTGVLAGGFIDILQLTAAGVITGTQFAGVTNIERLLLPGGINSVTLTNGMVNGTSLAGGFFQVVGGTGDDTVDGSGINNGKRLDIFGNAGVDVLKGGTADDILNGGAGNDLMTGGGGNDIYFVDATGDLVTESAGGGTGDTVYSTISYTLPADVEAVVLQGSANIDAAGNGDGNALIGNSGNNALDGRAGADYMAGGAGNDIYFVDNAGDLVVENAGEGTGDTVYSSVDYTLGPELEAVVLLGSGNLNAAGNNAVNALIGNSGNNNLDGKGGGDYMAGGAGNDIYFVDNAGDVVVENAGEGTADIVYATMDFTLPANVEAVVLQGSANLNAAGNGDGNALIGNSGNNVLDGKGGGDYMAGGAGNDTYFVDNAGDAVAENAGEGTADTINASINYTLGAELENLKLLAGAISGTGNAAANTITGNGSDNTLDGAGGTDALFGEGGNDNFLIPDSNFASIDGGAGLDRITLNTAAQSFNLTANVAKITNVEVIDLTSSSGASVTLAGTDIALINASGTSLYIVGGSDDQVDAGNGYTLIATGVVNNAVAAGHTFNEYQHSSGSLLFIDSTITPTIGAATNEAPTVQLDGAPDGLVLPDGVNHAAAYTTGDTAGVAISDTDATVDDPDTADSIGISSHITSLDAHIVPGVVAGPPPEFEALVVASEYLEVTAAGHTIATNNGLTITGEGTADLHVAGSSTDTVYQDLLREIRYVNTDTSVGGDYSDRQVTVQVQDGTGANSNIATATIDLTRGNHDPVITSGDGDTADISINEGVTAVTTVTASDADAGTSLSYSIVPGNDGGLFSIDGSGNLTFVSPPNFETPADLDTDGVYLVEVQVSDGVSSDTQLISVTVNDIAPSAPIDNNGAANTVAPGASTGSTVGVTALSTDVAGGPLFYAITFDDSSDGSTNGFQIDPSNGIVTVDDGSRIVAPGPYHITVETTDGTLASATTTEFTINVVTNTVPVANDDAASATEAGGVNNAVTGTDPSGNLITDAGPGLDTDAEDASTALTVVAVGTLAEGNPNNGTVGVGLAGQYGTLTVSSTGAYTYAVDQTNATVQALVPASTPLQDVFHYTIQDTGGGQDTATVTITVTGANDLPGAVADIGSMSEDAAPTSFNVILNDAQDLDTGATNAITITGTVASSGPGGTGINNGDATAAIVGNQIQVTLNGDFQHLSGTETATVTVPYTLTGNAGETSTASLVVTVNGANDGPTANNDSVAATEPGGTLNGTPGVNPSGNVITGAGSAGAVADTDPDTHDTLTVTAFGTLAEGNTDNGTLGNALAGLYGSLTLSSTGAYTYAVDPNNATVNALLPASTPLQDVFHYTISDGHGGTDSATFTVTISGANDLPDAVADTGSMGEDDAPTPFNVILNDAQDPDAGATNAITITGTVTATGPAGTNINNGDATASVVSNQIQVTLASADFQSLTGSETATVVVPYTLTGNAGETDTANLTVTVNGANDTVDAVDDSGAAFNINEDAVNPTFDVRLNDTKDVDHGATNNITINAGSLTATGPAADGIDASDVTTTAVTAGNLIQFTLGPDFQKLGAGESATITIGYTLHGDQAGDIDTATLTVVVNGVNDAPVAADFTFNGSNSAIANTSLVVDDPTDGAPNPTGPQKTVGGDLLAGASDVDTASSLWSITAGTVSNAAGSITFEADGDFTYLPAAGFTGNAVFNYTLNDNDPSGNATDIGQITINVATPKVWYVNASAAAGGDGTSDNPFNSLAALTTGGSADALDGANDIIFVYGGTYTGGIVLEDGQTLISQSQGLTVNGTTLEGATGSNAVINGAVVLASGNTIDGIDFGNSGAAGTFALSGANVGNAVITDSLINNTSGGAVSINGSGTGMSMVFTSVSSSGASTSAILLQETRGTFTANGGTLNNGATAAADIRLVGNSSNDDTAFTYTGSINDDQGMLVQVTGQSGGTKLFSGAITDGNDGDGAGIDLNVNTGATINFTGGLTLSTGSSAAFNATGGGTVNVTGTNHITTTTGTALNIANTTIGASNVTFHDISAGTGASGPTNGIVLNNTGTSGRLTVTGDGGGSNNGSGGTIQKTSGDGISLTSTQDVNLGYMNIINNLGNGIGGSTINGLVLNRMLISGNGNDAGTDESGINIAGLTGNASHATSISNSSITNNNEFEIKIGNSSGTLTNFVLTNNTISANGVGINGNVTSPHSDLVSFQALGTAVMGITTNGGTYTGNIDDAGGTKTITATGLFIDSSGTSSSVTADVNGGTFTNNNNAITVSTSNGGALDFDIDGTTSTGNRSHGLNLFVAANATGATTGSFTNNVVGTLGSDGSGSDIGFGIRVQMEALATANPVTVLISGNTVQEMENFSAINVNLGIAGQTSTRTSNITITGNTVRQIDNGRAIVVSQNNGTDADSAGIANVDIHGNILDLATIAGQVGDGTVIRIRQLDANGGDVNVVQTVATAAAVATELDDANGFNNPAKISVSGSIDYGQAAPPLPLLAAGGQGPGGAGTLTSAMLTPIVAEAVQHWIDAGISADQIVGLTKVGLTIANLADGVLATTSSGMITIDDDAAGWGWFVDGTPADNAEFATAHSATELAASSGDAAAHIDLLTAVTHELGHAMGLEHTDATGNVMDAELDLGIRRLTDSGIAQTQPPAGTPGPNSFVVDKVVENASAPHVDYHAAQGDTFDFSALPLSAGRSAGSDADLVRAVEDASGAFATLQVNTGPWVDVAQLDGAHAGDAVNVVLSTHVAHLHVELMA